MALLIYHADRLLRLLLTLFLLLPSLTCAGAATEAADSNIEPYGPELCVVNTPLLTRFFTAWNEVRVPVRGCAATNATAAPSATTSATTSSTTASATASTATATPGNKVTAHEVHVIRLVNTSSRHVRLEVFGDGHRHRLVLVLDTDLPVKWTVRASGIDPQTQHSIIVTAKSEVELSDLRASVTNRPKEGRAALQNFVERRYKSVASVSHVQGGDRVRLTLAPASAAAAATAFCDGDSADASPLVQAWRTHRQTVDGCFHAEQAGLYPKDVHVIDVSDGAAPDDTSPADVYVHLAAADAGESDEVRNVALVLHSVRPIRWLLSSAPQLTGSLVILAEYPVENVGLSPRQNIEIRSQSLPDSFAMLILDVTADLGPPVSYVKTQSATRLELIVSKKGKLDVKQDNLSGAASHSSPSMEMGVRSLDRGYNHHTPTRGGGSRSVTWTLQQALKVQCGAHHMTASLVRPTAEALGVVAIWLSDRTCLGRRNATHWVLRTHVTSCSSTSRIEGKLTSYTNLVHVQLGMHSDDEDFEGSGMDNLGDAVTVSEGSSRQVTIPIQCHQEPLFPTVSGFNQVDDDNVMDSVDVPVGGQVELYHMEIHRNKDWSAPVASDLNNAPSAVQVVFDETLHVRTWIDGVSYVQIVTEKCWVSNSSDSDWPARLILIRNTCPADLSVRIRSESRDLNGGFSFHVSKDYADMGQLFIHCKLGLCTNDEARAQGNLKVCVDPAQYCTGRHILKPFLEESVSTAQQILVRGPLRMVSKLAPALIPPVTSDASVAATAPGPGAPSTQSIIVVGVSTEVTVGIALASFVIGVGLTAILWCIHMRTDPYRRVGNRKSRSGRSNGRCPGVKCASPMIRARSLDDGQVPCGTAASELMQQQQPLNPQQQQQHLQKQQQQQQLQQQHQFSYDYDISSQSNSSESQCSREDSSPSPMNSAESKISKPAVEF